MSDYDDYEYPDENEGEAYEEDMTMKVQMDYEEILSQIRNGKIDRAKAIQELDNIFK